MSVPSLELLLSEWLRLTKKIYKVTTRISSHFCSIHLGIWGIERTGPHQIIKIKFPIWFSHNMNASAAQHSACPKVPISCISRLAASWRSHRWTRTITLAFRWSQHNLFLISNQIGKKDCGNQIDFGSLPKFDHDLAPRQEVGDSAWCPGKTFPCNNELSPDPNIVPPTSSSYGTLSFDWTLEH